MIQFELTDFGRSRGVHLDDYVGLIPLFLSEESEQTASEQFNVNYAHGGGWRSFPGFTMCSHNSIKYGSDHAMFPVALATLRDERIFVYPNSWVAIVQPDNSFEVCRMD